MGYRVVLEREAEAALERLRGADRARLLRAIAEQLTDAPTSETTNRKPLRAGAGAAWELRVQPFRVYYDVSEERRTVWVLGIYRKTRETVRQIG